jgi:hypothetical protein
MTKPEITYDLGYLVCQSCQERCDPAHRYHLQVDHIVAVNHRAIRTLFDVCAACYDRLFPWNLDLEER